MYKILMIDDDEKNLKATSSFLRGNNYDVVTTNSAAQAFDHLKEEDFALVLIDYQMPEVMGDALAEQILKQYPHQQIAMYSCDLSREAVKNSMRAGAIDFIEKTLPPQEFLAMIASYCNRYEMIGRTIRPAKSKSENRRLIESVRMVGESGAGKELIARAIHEQSSRSKGQFVAINCGAIPRELLESELFGHSKGAFTGAITDKIGKFALANNGTLFLDEIGDMPPELQVKLLRVLQEREIVPVGGKFPQKINVRIVCATHRQIEDLVAKGIFREDLMYRIKVVDIEAPPLRNRTDDIEPLVAFFTDRFNRKNGTKKFFQRRTLDVFKRYSWPGNVRELEATVEKHLVVSDQNIIRPDDLDLKLYGSTSVGTRGITFSEFRELKRSDELNFVETTIEEARGNNAEAARRLDITANHLQHLLNGSKVGRVVRLNNRSA